MPKSDHKFIDTQEDTGWYELNDWLRRNGFRGTKENRDRLREAIDSLRTNSRDNISWDELDEYLEECPKVFSVFEKA